MTSTVIDDSPIVQAYEELESASAGLREALVARESHLVADATRRLAEAGAAILAFTQDPMALAPETRGYVRGVAARVDRLNGGNLALIRRRITHLRQLRRDLGETSHAMGYGADGESKRPSASRDALDELA